MDHRHDDWIAWKARIESAAQEVRALDAREIAATEIAPRLTSMFEIAIEPATDSQAALASLMLIELCREVVDALHRGEPDRRCDCHLAAWEGLGEFTRAAGERNPCDAFRRWIAAFVAEWRRAHPPTLAERAAAIIRGDASRSWRLRELADRVGTRPSRLRQTFISRYGVRPSTYVHLVRVTRAVELLRTAIKVEAVAWELGYRSKKDLYRALKRWIDAMPTEIRSLSDAECTWLVQELRARCLGVSKANYGQRDFRRARNIRYASIPPTKAAAPMSATPE